MSKTVRQRMDQIYAERNKVVSALSKVFRSYLGHDPQTDYPVVYVELPTGQVSWHLKPGQDREWFPHLEYRDGAVWDGHSTKVKYQRLAKLEPRW